MNDRLEPGVRPAGSDPVADAYPGRPSSFAGHGTEVAGKNFLIPIDARLAKSGDLSLEAIALDSVLEQLAGTSRLKLVILDACRNNLFPMEGFRVALMELAREVAARSWVWFTSKVRFLRRITLSKP